MRESSDHVERTHSEEKHRNCRTTLDLRGKNAQQPKRISVSGEPGDRARTGARHTDTGNAARFAPPKDAELCLALLKTASVAQILPGMRHLPCLSLERETSLLA